MKLFLWLSLIGFTLSLAPVQSSHVEIAMGGGYAMVMADAQTLVVSPIKKPSIFSFDYMDHPMKMVVQIGYLNAVKTTLPTTAVGGGRTGWDITGRTVELLNEDRPFPADNITLPPYQAVQDCQQVSNTQINNLFFLPDVPKMSGEKRLATDWRDRLEGSLTFQGGTLEVSALTPGCFEFKKNGKVTRKQQLASGTNGVTYSHPVGAYLTLRVYEDAKKANKLGDVVVVPEGGVIRLVINTRDTMESVPERPIKHFKYFYDLLSQKPSAREIPTWLGAKASDVSPGEACPPSFYSWEQ